MKIEDGIYETTQPNGNKILLVSGPGMRPTSFSLFGHGRTAEDTLALARSRREGASRVVDPVLAYVRGMRRDDTKNPGPTGTTTRRATTVVHKQADAMPEGVMRGEFKRAGLPGGEYLEAIIKEYAARYDGQEPLAVTMEGESPFLDALAASLDIEVIHV